MVQQGPGAVRDRRAAVQGGRSRRPRHSSPARRPTSGAPSATCSATRRSPRNARSRRASWITTFRPTSRRKRPSIRRRPTVDTAQLNVGFTKVRSLIDGVAAIATAQIGDLVEPGEPPDHGVAGRSDSGLLLHQRAASTSRIADQINQRGAGQDAVENRQGAAADPGRRQRVPAVRDVSRRRSPDRSAAPARSASARRSPTRSTSCVPANTAACRRKRRSSRTRCWSRSAR